MGTYKNAFSSSVKRSCDFQFRWAGGGTTYRHPHARFPPFLNFQPPIFPSNKPFLMFSRGYFPKKRKKRRSFSHKKHATASCASHCYDFRKKNKKKEIRIFFFKKKAVDRSSSALRFTRAARNWRNVEISVVVKQKLDKKIEIQNRSNDSCC